MPKLTQDLVTRYAKYQALKNLLDKWLEAKRAEIMKAFRRGERCPGRGPFLLESGPRKVKADWKNEFAMHMRGHGLDNKAILKLVEQIEGKPRNTRTKPSLYCKRNPNYRRKFPIRLPA